MLDEMKNVAAEAAADLIDLAEMGMKDFNSPILENFPATACRTVEVDGVVYSMMIEIKLRPCRY